MADHPRPHAHSSGDVIVFTTVRHAAGTKNVLRVTHGDDASNKNHPGCACQHELGYRLASGADKYVRKWAVDYYDKQATLPQTIHKHIDAEHLFD